MHNYIFDKFDEVEESIKKIAPPFVYKYRGDWKNKYHRELITEQLAWFAAPRELNDPHDIRIPMQFDLKEIEHPLFFEKLKKQLLADNPSTAFTERDLNVICENKLDEIRSNPQAYFEKNYRDLRESNTYDRVGLFSCTTDELNEKMWAHYANNYTGFVVGFITVELCRNFLSGAGPVKYSDEVPLFSFIYPKPDEDFDNYYLKSTKWIDEKEFRFQTISDDHNFNRAKKFTVESVSEFLIGTKFPEDQKEEFINEIRKIYSKEIPIYQVIPKVSGFGLEKIKIR